MWFNWKRLTEELVRLCCSRWAQGIKKASWYSCFSILSPFRLLHCTGQLPVHYFMDFTILWLTLAVSSVFAPWVSSWPRYPGWVTKRNATVHASWLSNLATLCLVDLKICYFLMQIVSSAGRWLKTKTQTYTSLFTVVCAVPLLWSFSHLLATD